MTQTYEYSYRHPISGNQIYFSTFTSDLAYAVWVDGQVTHFYNFEVAVSFRHMFSERQTFILPLTRVPQ